MDREHPSSYRHPIKLRAAALAWYVVANTKCPACGNPDCDRASRAYTVYLEILPHIRTRSIRDALRN